MFELHYYDILDKDMSDRVDTFINGRPKWAEP